MASFWYDKQIYIYMQIATYVLILSNPIWRYPSLIHKFEIFFKIQQSEGEATLRGGFFSLKSLVSFVWALDLSKPLHIFLWAPGTVEVQDNRFGQINMEPEPVPCFHPFKCQRLNVTYFVTLPSKTQCDICYCLILRCDFL